MRCTKSINILSTLSLIGSTALLSAAETTDQPHFSQVDLNGDNLISKAELMAHLEAGSGNLFDKLDADNNGQLNPKEFSKLKKWGGKGKKRGKKAGSNNGNGTN